MKTDKKGAVYVRVSTNDQSVEMYKKFMDFDLDDNVMKFYSKKTQSSIFGDNGFVEMVKEKFVKSDSW